MLTLKKKKKKKVYSSSFCYLYYFINTNAMDMSHKLLEINSLNIYKIKVRGQNVCSIFNFRWISSASPIDNGHLS